MKKILKIIINSIINLLFKLFGKFKLFRYIAFEVNKNFSNKTFSVDYKNTQLKFYVPNQITMLRIKTFSTKEPETLDWIDKFEENSIFYDVGANIGLYSCYASKKKNCFTIAFEPSIFNLEILGKNIFINEITNNVKIFSLPVNDYISSGDINFSSTEKGAALSTFNKNYTVSGNEIKKTFSIQTWGISLDSAIKVFNLPQPDYIKIDVDGTDHLILKGAEQILKKTKGVLVEIDDQFQEQKKSSEEILTKSGFKMEKKERSKIFVQQESLSLFNQIWYKDQ